MTNESHRARAIQAAQQLISRIPAAAEAMQALPPARYMAPRLEAVADHDGEASYAEAIRQLRAKRNVVEMSDDELRLIASGALEEGASV